MTQDSKTQTVATTPEDAETLLESLEVGDRVRFDDDEWKVTKTNGHFVTFKARTGYHPGTTTLKPSSGYQNSAVVTHSRGMGSHYGRIEVVVDA